MKIINIAKMQQNVNFKGIPAGKVPGEITKILYVDGTIGRLNKQLQSVEAESGKEAGNFVKSLYGKLLKLGDIKAEWEELVNMTVRVHCESVIWPKKIQASRLLPDIGGSKMAAKINQEWFFSKFKAYSDCTDWLKERRFLLKHPLYKENEQVVKKFVGQA